jgi:signal transduction histidine kinase
MASVFNPEQIDTKGHYGLINMKQRAREIGAVLNIDSRKNAGTIIELTLG